MPSRPKRQLSGNSLSIVNRHAKSPRIAGSDTEFSEHVTNPVSHTRQDRLDEGQITALLESLDFSQINSRYDTIDNAYGKTCIWLSETPEYLDWLEPNKLHEHHGFLWIKAHPGAGKSTLVKSALHNAGKTMSGDFISFFFNAGGDELEKSTVGMYRSLLFQLLRKIPRLQTVFNSLGRTVRSGKIPQWSINPLKTLFESTIENLEQSPLTCFIDAIDECGVMQIRDMISFFESISEMAMSRGISFRVCLSSRHYPYITISKGLSLDLGQQVGHDQDIVSYITGKLKLGGGKLAQQIQTQLIEKASGIFTWIVLVVGILQREYDDGYTHTLLQRLDDIPEDLDELFRNILSRDSRHEAQLLLCIQWALFSRYPLRAEQLYLAIIVGVDPIAASTWEPDQVGDADVRRFILSSSKGLVEVNKSRDNPTVQFIHGSVREFFFKDGLRSIWPDLKGNFRGESHEQLKQCCIKYLSIVISSPGLKFTSWRLWEHRIQAERKFPLLEYALWTVIYHANEALAFGVDQAQFLQNFDLAGWIRLEEKVQEREYHNFRRHFPTTSLLYILAGYNAAKLIASHPDKLSAFKAEEGAERHGMPILVAVATNSRQAVYALLKAQADTEPATSPLHSLCEQYDQTGDDRIDAVHYFRYSKSITPFLNLVAAGDEQVVIFAITSATINMKVDWKGAEGASAVARAVRNGQESMLHLLLNKGASRASLHEADGNGLTLLHHCLSRGREAMLRLLLTEGVNVEAATTCGRTPLHYAADGGHVAILQLLLDSGANTEALSNEKYTPIHLAAGGGHAAAVQLLLDRGANINAATGSGSSILHLASKSGNADTAHLVLEKGINTEATSYGNQTPLHFAAMAGHLLVVQLLLDNGANKEAVNEDHNTALHLAIGYGSDPVVQLLLGRDANIYAVNRQGDTPLSLVSSSLCSNATKKAFLEKHAELDMTAFIYR